MAIILECSFVLCALDNKFPPLQASPKLHKSVFLSQKLANTKDGCRYWTWPGAPVAAPCHSSNHLNVPPSAAGAEGHYQYLHSSQTKTFSITTITYTC